MIWEVAIAAMIGIMFAHTWMCVILCLGAAAEGETASKYFIVGRFIGVTILGMGIWLLRLALQGYMQYVILLFGIFSIAFAGIVLVRQYLEKRLEANRASSDKGCTNCAHGCGHGDQESGAVDEKGLFWAKCNCGIFSPVGSSCDHDGGACASYSSKDSKRVKRRFGAGYGFSLGLFRGVTPCAKVVLLSPLLVSVTFFEALVLVMVYAGASTVYPVIGLFSAKLLKRVQHKKILIRAIGAMMLFGIGIYSIVKYLEWDVTNQH